VGVKSKGNSGFERLLQLLFDIKHYCSRKFEIPLIFSRFNPRIEKRNRGTADPDFR
jgi:hypothetical protein